MADGEDKKLETIGAENWRDFVGGDLAVLMLGKSDCAACARWTEELSAWLETEHAAQAGVRFGKLLLDQRGLVDFKREHGAWLKDLDVLPFTTIWVRGERKKGFAGSGVARLEARLNNVRAEGTPPE